MVSLVSVMEICSDECKRRGRVCASTALLAAGVDLTCGFLWKAKLLTHCLASAQGGLCESSHLLTNPLFDSQFIFAPGGRVGPLDGLCNCLSAFKF